MQTECCTVEPIPLSRLGGIRTLDFPLIKRALSPTELLGKMEHWVGIEPTTD